MPSRRDRTVGGQSTTQIRVVGEVHTIKAVSGTRGPRFFGGVAIGTVVKSGAQVHGGTMIARVHLYFGNEIAHED